MRDDNLQGARHRAVLFRRATVQGPLQDHPARWRWSQSTYLTAEFSTEAAAFEAALDAAKKVIDKEHVWTIPTMPSAATQLNDLQ